MPPWQPQESLARGALVTSVASAIEGMRIARQAPEGDTPVESGTEPVPDTPEETARSQRLSAFLGTATVALVAGVLGLSGSLLDTSGRRCNHEERRKKRSG